MIGETYDSSTFIEDNADTLDEGHRNLAERILDDTISQQHVRKFMWNYVGHPEREARQSGERPDVFQDGKAYAREVFTGYSEEGDLFHVRAIPGMMTEAQGFLVVWGDVHTGVSEAIVLDHSRASGGIEPNDLTLFLLDRRARDNSPRGHCPGEYAHPRDQSRLHLYTDSKGQQSVVYYDGLKRTVRLHEIEQLYDVMDRVEADRIALSRAAMTLVTQ